MSSKQSHRAAAALVAFLAISLLLAFGPDAARADGPNPPPAWAGSITSTLESWVPSGSIATSSASTPIGGDDRQPLAASDPAQHGIVWLEIFAKSEDGEYPALRCSGVIAGPRAVLTAAHCLKGGTDEEDQASKILVVPAKNGTTEPFGSQEATKWHVPSSFDPTTYAGSLRDDFGLIVLPDATLTSRSGGFPGKLAALTDAEISDANSSFAMMGYPGDCSANVCGPAADATLSGPGRYAWMAPATFVWPSSDALMDDADGTSGMSGSPFVRRADLAIAGIAESAGHDFNHTVRITPALISTLQSWCQADGCSLNVAEPAPPPSRPYRLFMPGVSGDSTFGTCGSERAFLASLAASTEGWQRSSLAFLDAVFSARGGTPVPQAQFDKAFADVQAFSQKVIALTPPNTRFVGFHANLDYGMQDWLAGTRLLKDSIDKDSRSLWNDGDARMSEASRHLTEAESNFPGLDRRCQPTASAVTGLPDVQVLGLTLTGKSGGWINYRYVVYNAGGTAVDLSKFTIQSWLSADPLLQKGKDRGAAGSTLSGVLNPGELRQLSFGANTNGINMTGLYYVIVEVHSFGTIPERTLDNNYDAASISSLP